MILQSNLDAICKALETSGYIILPTLLPETLTDALSQRVREISEQFQAAGIGRQQQHQLNQEIRSDRTQWLRGNHPAEKDYLACMTQLQTTLNRNLFLGLSDYESHFAYYLSVAPINATVMPSKENQIVLSPRYSISTPIGKMKVAVNF